MEEPPILVSRENDRDSGEVQADRFLGSLIFGAILVTAICLVASGMYIQGSRSLVFSGISLGVADAAGLLIWRLHAPEFFWFWPRIYFAGIGFTAIFIYGMLSVLFGT